MRDTQNPTSQVCSVAAAADILEISRDFAYRLARAGKLPGCMRLGGTYRVSLPALRRAIDAGDASLKDKEGVE